MTDGDMRLTHAWEQMLALMLEMAAALGRYREELEKAGFRREEAVSMCVCYQTAFVEASLRRSRAPGGDAGGEGKMPGGGC